MSPETSLGGLVFVWDKNPSEGEALRAESSIAKMALVGAGGGSDFSLLSVKGRLPYCSHHAVLTVL
jgi:hypothetical protein